MKRLLSLVLTGLISCKNFKYMDHQYASEGQEYNSEYVNGYSGDHSVAFPGDDQRKEIVTEYPDKAYSVDSTKQLINNQ